MSELEQRESWYGQICGIASAAAESTDPEVELVHLQAARRLLEEWEADARARLAARAH